MDKKQLTIADSALTYAGYCVRKVRTDPANSADWLKAAAEHVADASKAIKAAAPAAPKKAPAKKAAPKNAKK